MDRKYSIKQGNSSRIVENLERNSLYLSKSIQIRSYKEMYFPLSSFLQSLQNHS